MKNTKITMKKDNNVNSQSGHILMRPRPQPSPQKLLHRKRKPTGSRVFPGYSSTPMVVKEPVVAEKQNEVEEERENPARNAGELAVKYRAN
jgi:hypothetical protein